MIHFSIYDKKKLVNCYLDFMFYRNIEGQTASDSLAIVSAQWKVESPQKGLIYKYASIPRLYQGPQSVSLIEVDPVRA